MNANPEEDDEQFYGKKLMILKRPVFRQVNHKHRAIPCTIGDFTFREWQRILAKIVLNPYARQWLTTKVDHDGKKVEIIVRLYDPTKPEEEQELWEEMNPPPVPLQEKTPPKIKKKKIKREVKMIYHEECAQFERPLPEGYEYEMGTLVPINPKKQSFKVFKNPFK